MQYWLLKSEPDVWSITQQEKAGAKGAIWDGVRNYQARNNLKAMKKGDQVFFYHSNEGKEIVGVTEVLREHYQDPTTDDDRWVVVDLKVKKSLKRSISLAEIKKDPILSKMSLIKQSRLSVLEIEKKHFDRIIKKSNEK